jgi:DNA-binding NtrC family response regulator
MTRILVVGEAASAAAAGLARDASLEHAPSGADALARIGADAPPDLVLVSGAGAADLDLIRACRLGAADTPVIVVAAEGSVAAAMEAVHAGAFDYLPASVGAEGLALATRQALRQRRPPGGREALAGEAAASPAVPGLVGACPAMLDLYKTAARVAATEATVLLLGERSTGRELLARAIHASSPRAAGPFVAVDCGAMAEESLEARLFGDGAAPGAAPDGLLHAARGGTLYLEAVSRLGRHAQSRFLRALEEGLPPRDGSPGRAPPDFRLVAASDEDLRALAKRGRFREDLLYRLDVVALNVPPLRERREDIPRLAEHFAAKHAPGGRAEVSPSARHALLAYRWPGNLRELESAIARALALAAKPVVLPENLPPSVTAAPSPAGEETPLPGLLVPNETSIPRNTPAPRATPAPAEAAAAREGALPTLAEMDRRYAWEVLRGVGGNKTRAAEILGIDRKTLYRLLGEEGGNGR